ncbi:1-phosphatidylinositol-3-phosphate 5-kinase [Nymphaea thermarum]|nr:1-phosphatidylinositol-3-phosphate 5-kinase [Nymphaea thermarum]
MEILDGSLLHLTEKLRAWIDWRGDVCEASGDTCTWDENCSMCYECNSTFNPFHQGPRCGNCGRPFCVRCVQGDTVYVKQNSKSRTALCILCFNLSGLEMPGQQSENHCLVDRVGSSVQPSLSFKTDSTDSINMDDCSRVHPDCGGDCLHEPHSEPDHANYLGRFLKGQSCSFNKFADDNIPSPLDPPSPVSLYARDDGSETRYFMDADDIGNKYPTPICQYSQDVYDVDASSNYTRSELYSFRSSTSSPFDSPTVMNISPERADSPMLDEQQPMSLDYALLFQEKVEMLRSPKIYAEDVDTIDHDTDELSIYQKHSQTAGLKLDFENDGTFWLPPPPEDEDDEVENNIFKSDNDEEDDDDDIGDPNLKFSSTSLGDDVKRNRDKSNEVHKEPLRAVVHGHFRALVSQLLKGEGITVGNDRTEDCWLEIVSSLAWQAANFVRPDTSGGGSMDPVDYVKVKCIACGRRSDSALIKGVVCTKNVKHKRMTSQYKTPRLLLLGGALEYQRLPNQLASIGTLLDQEMDHIKMAVSKIEAHHPNVLLVEKSVSSYAQEYLLAKEISLVLNVKRPLLDRIARCTGAQIVPSIDKIFSPRLGQCEVFRLERVVEECRSSGSTNKKSVKTLMFFEGCPRRLGCTVLLRGAPREELKKVKHVIQYAVFAAYHLSLETSFLADEGATLPKLSLELPITLSEKPPSFGKMISVGNCEHIAGGTQFSSLCSKLEFLTEENSRSSFHSENDCQQSPNAHGGLRCHSPQSPIMSKSPTTRDISVSKSPTAVEAFISYGKTSSSVDNEEVDRPVTTDMSGKIQLDEGVQGLQYKTDGTCEKTILSGVEGKELSKEFLSTVDTHQSILVLLSSRCVLKGTVCERPQLLRIKFYGSFDKPLGRFLQDDLFDQTYRCQSCSEPAEAHVRCYSHQQGSLTICVKRLPSLKLPGEREGKIWMWHRCLRCAVKDGISQATKRVVMSDAAWGLSFGKFLELSFSNHATANRVASCGHSLQRDCLRYYGSGNMIAFFRYAPIDILTVFLPPSMLECRSNVQQEWIGKETIDVSEKMNFLYAEVSDALQKMEQHFTASGPGCETSTSNGFQNYMVELKNLLKFEKSEYGSLLQSDAVHNWPQGVPGGGIFELSYLRRCLLVDSYLWDRRLCVLDSLSKEKKSPIKFKRESTECKDATRFCSVTEKVTSSREDQIISIFSGNSPTCHTSFPRSMDVPESHLPIELNSLNLCSHDPVMSESSISAVEGYSVEDSHDHFTDASESLSAHDSNLSDKIDMAWTGTVEFLSALNNQISPSDTVGVGSVFTANQSGRIPSKNIMAPQRVYSFDSVLRSREKSYRSLFPPHLSLIKSFHISAEYEKLVQEPMPNIRRFYFRDFSGTSQRFDFILSYTPSFISSTYRMVSEGPRLLLPTTGRNDIVVAVYDNEPTSIIAYALSSKEYDAFVSDTSVGVEGDTQKRFSLDENSMAHHLGHAPQISYQLDSDEMLLRSYGSDSAVLSSGRSLISDSPKSPHFRMMFGDDSSSPTGKVKFTVTCYFARQFDALRKKCCPSEIDFMQSLSRCHRWSAQGGKSNVYFARTMDERFIVKQVTKTELESFEEFAPDYFKYLSHSLSSGSPTCLAKVLGIYQVTTKHLKSGKEAKMDFMVMENLFFGRTLSGVYDLKGSARSRYNPDTSGSNKVLLDQNLVEVLRTKPIFLGSKPKRVLERAVWNDTSFLASVDVMDYSLLVGVDEERKELVLGIIDFMRQYTWDKHLETWVKAARILGGPKNVSPTVISPKQYKKRFRKAMSSYFLMVPEQWS